MLSLNNVEVIYDGVILVLKGVSLEVRDGGITSASTGWPGLIPSGIATVWRAADAGDRPRASVLCGLGRMQATGISPHSGSGRPMTAASAMSG
jgi:hypothetical protein